MIKIGDKTQLYHGVFQVREHEEVEIEVPISDTSLRFKFTFERGSEKNSASYTGPTAGNVSWETKDGVANFLVSGVPFGRVGGGAVDMARVGGAGSQTLYFQMGYSSVSSDSVLVNLFFYVGGPNA